MLRRAQSTVRWGLMLLVAALLLGIAALGVVRLTRPMVSVTRVVEGPVVQAFYATGTLLPDREFPIKSNVEGTVTQMLVDKGDQVAKGQQLAFVVVDEYQFRLQQAKAELQLRRSQADERTSPVLGEFDARLAATGEMIEIAKRERDRLTQLEQRAAASSVDIDRATDRLQELLSRSASLEAQKQARKLELERDVAVAQAALEIAQWNVDQQTIRSPIDGKVLDRPVSLGTRVRVNDELMRIADVAPANLVMRASVDEEDKTEVTEGQVVRMTLYSFPGQVFSGVVKRIYPMADPDRRTFEVDVTMTPPDARFAAGMTGELAFIVREKARSVIVPAQAVQNGSVLVVRDGRVQRRPVQIGITSVERAEIISGVSLGEQVVISPGDGLQDGQAVRVEMMDPIVAAGLNKKPVEEQPFKSFD